MQVVHQSHHHQQVPLLQHVGCRWVHHQAALRSCRQHVDPEVFAQIQIPERAPHKRFWNLDLLDAVLFIQGQPLHQVGAHQFKAQALALHSRGKDHPVGPHPLQHFFVEVTRCPRDHLAHAAPLAVFGDQGRGDAGLDRFTDRHHDSAHFKHAGFPQGLFVGAVHDAGLHAGLHLTQFIHRTL